jgi:hypothetical protein
MKLTEISSLGLEYTILLDEAGVKPIGIEIVTGIESRPETAKFIRDFWEVSLTGWKMTIYKDFLIMKTNLEELELPLIKNEAEIIAALFDEKISKQKFQLVPIYGKYPGFQLLV